MTKDSNLKRLRETKPSTRAQMEARVKFWQDKLKLTHWDILIRWDACLTDDEAEVTTADSYLLASLKLSDKWPQWTDEWADSTIAHEMLHIFFRDQDVAAASASAGMSGSTYDMFWNRYDHERESSVDLLATILVELVKSGEDNGKA